MCEILFNEDRVAVCADYCKYIVPKSLFREQERSTKWRTQEGGTKWRTQAKLNFFLLLLEDSWSMDVMAEYARTFYVVYKKFGSAYVRKRMSICPFVTYEQLNRLLGFREIRYRNYL